MAKVNVTLTPVVTLQNTLLQVLLLNCPVEFYTHIQK